MPPDLAALDLIAFVWFVTAWVGFTVIQDHLLTGHRVVNQHLKVIRRHWMERMLERDNRIMDSQLVGHTMQSCTFFASTNMLILAGLVGSFGAIEHAHEIITNLSFTVKTSRQLFEIKILLMVVVFTFGFFKFTWALRQYNYCCALIGSAPITPLPPEERRAMGETIAEALTLAVTALNGGMRSYYFALAVLAWMVGPLFFMLATATVLVVLTRRQAFSLTEKVIRVQTDRLEGKDTTK
ncbi:DUF599 domain-containing protein [Azospirillum doebereinerae]|uniref:DUF599 family protein n=1 Tax=Azospirillum doebereinerae TaxID=92933 RepID=A0A433J8V3_9PROT|nr:DUF599 domain-containing protein [Azospirillum doebereinerae]MCG5243756.1 DUF599 domain-containing protein [Azospirillum doebereinerae]RUQ70785.1 DUF599 family protein [Azospirillum doebereinerae]